MTPVRLAASLAVAFAVVLVAGCKDLRKGEYAEAFEWTAEPAWNERTILKHGWSKPQPKPLPPPIWCYKTLAAVDCYTAPLPDEFNRLVNKDNPSN